MPDGETRPSVLPGGGIPPPGSTWVPGKDDTESVEESGNHGHEVRIDVTLSTRSVAAGSPLSLKCAVTCSHGCDLRGTLLTIEDAQGGAIDIVTLSGVDGTSSSTPAFTVAAPSTPGVHTWSVAFLGREEDRAAHLAVAAPFTFTVEPHATNVLVWAVPSAIVTEEPFHLKVGVTCTSGCDLSGRSFEILDQQGSSVASGSVGSEPLPGSTGLYVADVELHGRGASGHERWTAVAPAHTDGVPHAAATHTFGVIFVEAPESLVTIEAYDQERKAAIAGLHVLLHPYRAFTDERGVAELRVPNGTYEVFVSGFRYVPVRRTLEVTSDLTTRAELLWEPEGSDDPYA